MTDQPPGEPNRYARLGPEAQALVDDHDAIALAELLVKAHDDLAALRQVARGYCPQCGRGDAAPTVADWEQQKLRADEAEQHLRNIAQGGPRADAVQAEIGEMIRQTHELREQLDRAKAELADRDAAESADAAAGSYANGNEHAIAHPQPWLHILFTSPDETTANTSALNLRDHLEAEFDGVNMHITTNAVEGDGDLWGNGGRLAQSGVDTPGCDCGHDGMGISWHGDDCPWRCGVLEAGPSRSPGAEKTEPNNPAATEATSLREQLHAAIESELYEYRERTMWWPEGAITGEIARLATRGALEVLQPQDGTHIYLSTGCWHGDHDYCKSMTGLNGAKRPASCKKCGAKCICPCHDEQPQEAP